DVKYDAFLLNGRGPDAPWTLAAKTGERIRLRIINAAGSTYFPLRLDDHPLAVTRLYRAPAGRTRPGRWRRRPASASASGSSTPPDRPTSSSASTTIRSRSPTPT